MEKERKPNLTRQSKRNLKERYLYLTERVKDNDLDDDERLKYLAEIKFIKEVMPDNFLKQFDITGVITAIITGGIAIGAAALNNFFTNKGMFNKDSSEALRMTNFLKR